MQQPQQPGKIELKVVIFPAKGDTEDLLASKIISTLEDPDRNILIVPFQKTPADLPAPASPVEEMPQTENPLASYWFEKARECLVERNEFKAQLSRANDKIKELTESKPSPVIEIGETPKLNIALFSKLSAERAETGFKTYKNVPITYWTTALAGEVGELCNMIKKMERVAHGGIDGGSSYTAASLNKTDLAEEIGGIFIYLNILSGLLDIDTEEAIIETFNSKSIKYGFAQIYPPSSHPALIVDDKYRKALQDIADKVLEYDRAFGDNGVGNHCRNIALEALAQPSIVGEREEDKWRQVPTGNPGEMAYMKDAKTEQALPEEVSPLDLIEANRGTMAALFNARRELSAAREEADTYRKELENAKAAILELEKARRLLQDKLDKGYSPL